MVTHESIRLPCSQSARSRPINLAVLTLAGAATITDLAAGHGASRKFVYQQANKASAALAEVFASSVPDNAVLFERPVTKTWLRQLTLGLSLTGIAAGSVRRHPGE